MVMKVLQYEHTRLSDSVSSLVRHLRALFHSLQGNVALIDLLILSIKGTAIAQRACAATLWRFLSLLASSRVCLPTALHMHIC